MGDFHIYQSNISEQHIYFNEVRPMTFNNIDYFAGERKHKNTHW